MMTNGQVLYAIHDGVCIVKFIGDIRFTMCTAINRFLRNFFNQPEQIPVIVDLTDVAAIDSSALGTLAQVAINMKNTFERKTNLLVHDEDLLILLRSVSFDKVFNIMQRNLSAEYGFKEIEPIEPDEEQFAQDILTAHNNLMRLSESDEVDFIDVIEAINNK